MPKRKAPDKSSRREAPEKGPKKPGTAAVKQAKKGEVKHAVRIVSRAMKSDETKPELAAKSRTVVRRTSGTKLGKKIFKKAKKRAERKYG